MKRITEVEGLAPAAGPYSFAVVSGNTVYTAGQIGQTAEGTIVAGGVEAEAHQVMGNLGKILGTVALGFQDVVKATIYLTDVADFAKVNEVYKDYFAEGEYPVRVTTGAAKLPLGALVEISLVAVMPDEGR